MIQRLRLLLFLVLLLAGAVAFVEEPDVHSLANCNRITGSVSPAA